MYPLQYVCMYILSTVRLTTGEAEQKAKVSRRKAHKFIFAVNHMDHIKLLIEEVLTLLKIMSCF